MRFGSLAAESFCFGCDAVGFFDGAAGTEVAVHVEACVPAGPAHLVCGSSPCESCILWSRGCLRLDAGQHKRSVVVNGVGNKQSPAVHSRALFMVDVAPDGD